MAVFMLNICKFNDCGLTFPSLGDLIHHIEDTHIDYDPAIIEQKEQQQPQCLPLSYVLKFYSNSPRKETQFNDIKSKIIRHANKSLNSNQIDEVSTGSEESNDSWIERDDLSSKVLLKSNKTNSSLTSAVKMNDSDRPFVCNVPGCTKRYKNLNGIKYHIRNGHKKEEKLKMIGFHSKKIIKTINSSTNQKATFLLYSDKAKKSENCDILKENEKYSTGNKINFKQTDPKILKALRLKTIVKSNYNNLLTTKVLKTQETTKPNINCVNTSETALDFNHNCNLIKLPLNTATNY